MLNFIFHILFNGFTDCLNLHLITMYYVPSTDANTLQSEQDSAHHNIMFWLDSTLLDTWKFEICIFSTELEYSPQEH